MKKAIPVLAVLCGILLAANLITLYIINQRVEKIAASSEPTSVSVPQIAAQVPAQGDTSSSLGTQAGQAVGTLQVQAQDSYKVMSDQTEKTRQELEKTTQETVKILNQQAGKISADLQVAIEKLSESLNRELGKFNESLKNKTSKT